DGRVGAGDERRAGGAAAAVGRWVVGGAGGVAVAVRAALGAARLRARVAAGRVGGGHARCPLAGVGHGRRAAGGGVADGVASAAGVAGRVVGGGGSGGAGGGARVQ